MTAKKLNPGVAAMLDNEQAALLFVGGQYLFRSRGSEGDCHYKFVSPAAVRVAFSNETIDTGWLAPVTSNVTPERIAPKSLKIALTMG
jgi:hypothetical protein